MTFWPVNLIARNIEGSGRLPLRRVRNLLSRASVRFPVASSTASSYEHRQAPLPAMVSTLEPPRTLPTAISIAYFILPEIVTATLLETKESLSFHSIHSFAKY
jgi:hypothetical protein